LQMHMPSGQHLVLLKQKDARRYLPIWIGPTEAIAIRNKLTNTPTKRPLTHDLMANAIRELGITMVRVVISEVKDETYHSRLFLALNGREVELDARSSDCVALALRLDCPLFAMASVLDQAGVVPGRKLNGQVTSEKPSEEERLAVFRELVNNLDLPAFPDEPKS
ncbi:MAG: bifunctional nuclease family protein, partial [Candidatus Dormibacteraceae bacterium]